MSSQYPTFIPRIYLFGVEDTGEIWSLVDKLDCYQLTWNAIDNAAFNSNSRFQAYSDERMLTDFSLLFTSLKTLPVTRKGYADISVLLNPDKIDVDALALFGKATDKIHVRSDADARHLTKLAEGLYLMDELSETASKLRFSGLCLESEAAYSFAHQLALKTSIARQRLQIDFCKRYVF